MSEEAPPNPDAATQPEADGPGASWVGRLLEERYRVTGLLGRGGMGSTWTAEDTRLTGKQVVVKVPHPELLVDRGFRARYRREVEALIALEHSAVVHVLDVGVHAGQPFMVMQYLGGGSLAERVAEAPNRRLPPEEVVRLLTPIARALDYMHGRKMLHRDVKPDNVLLDEGGRAYLADFGIAKAASGADAGLTATGFAPGTPRYMAPEQARSNRFDGRADQYALAVTAYELLSGRAPFDGETPVSLLMQKQSEDPLPLDDLAHRIPPPAARALMRGLAREPADRFDTCGQFLEALARGFGTNAANPTGAGGSARAPASPPGEASRRRAGRRVAAAVLVLAVGGLVAFLAWGAGSDPDNGRGRGAGPGPGVDLLSGGSVDVDPQAIEETLRVFTDAFGARDSEDERRGAAVDLHARLSAYGLVPPPGLPRGIRRHTPDTGDEVYNVYACLPGRLAADAENGLGEFILVSTWFDGQIGADGQRPAPAANSNGSGVAALLEIARCVTERAARDGSPRRSIVFACFDLHSSGDAPHVGASLAVEEGPLPLEDCVCMLTIERLGRSLADMLPGVLVLMGTERAPHFARLADSIPFPERDLLHMGLDIYAGAPDALPFLERGVPALLLGAGPSMDYGKPSDTIERLDLPSLVARAEWIRAFVTALAEDDARPALQETTPSLREVRDIGRAIDLGNETYSRGLPAGQVPHQGIRTALGRLNERVRALSAQDEISARDRRLLVQQLRLVWQVAALWRGR